MIWSIEKFRPYLEGFRFTVNTDHHSLIWLNRLKDLIGRLAWWAIRLQQFDFDNVHRKGKDHVVPDLLSRSVSENVSLIEVRGNSIDPWYKQLLANIRADLDAYLSGLD